MIFGSIYETREHKNQGTCVNFFKNCSLIYVDFPVPRAPNIKKLSDFKGLISRLIMLRNITRFSEYGQTLLFLHQRNACIINGDQALFVQTTQSNFKFLFTDTEEVMNFI